MAPEPTVWDLEKIARAAGAPSATVSRASGQVSVFVSDLDVYSLAVRDKVRSVVQAAVGSRWKVVVIDKPSW